MKNVKKSIKMELLIILGSMALVTALFIVILFYNVINKDIVPFTEKSSNQILLSNANYIGNWIESRRNIIGAIAISANARNGKWDNLSEELEEIYKNHKNDYENLFYTDDKGNGISSSGETISISYKDYFKELIRGKKDIVITEPFISGQSNREVFTIASSIKNSAGNIIGLVGATIPLNKISHIVNTMNVGGYGYGWIIDETGLILSHPNKSYVLNFNIFKDSDKYGYKNIAETFGSTKKMSSGTIIVKGKKEKTIFTSIPYSNNWSLIISIPISEFYKNSNSLIKVLYVVIIFLTLSLTLIALFLSDNLSKPLKDISIKIKKLEEGNLNVKFESNRKDEIGIIQEALNNLTSKLNSILLNTQSSSKKIDSISSKIAESNEDFSKRILSDSSKIEQISATTEELTASFDLTAENANQSINIAKKTIEMTEKSKINMDKTVKSVSELGKISTKISEIMNFINKVAFQTNLLAVNASVEAARVGKEGSGFAVVASEIRSLSRKISEYSLEIGKLLTTNQMTVNEVNDATKNVKKSFETMEEYTTDLVDKSNGISLAVVEQSDAIRQIADAIIDMSASMQSNTEIIENISKIVQTLKDEANLLNSMTANYKLKLKKD
jgi:methyl-accepting chemotaxis protein